MLYSNPTVLILYNLHTDSFSCLSEASQSTLWKELTACEDNLRILRTYIHTYISQNMSQAYFTQLSLNGNEYHACLISTALDSNITLALTQIIGALPNPIDSLTGLLTRDAFCKIINEFQNTEPFAILYFDFHRFKVINDLFGRRKGDELLKYIADCLKNSVPAPGISTRLIADHFAVFLPTQKLSPEQLVKEIFYAMKRFDLPFEITFHVGIYQATTKQLSTDAMIDRAALAQSTIKGNYNIRYAYYTTEMRKALLSEQEITGIMATALEEKQFMAYFQPQYNHSTGMLVGAEALVRWLHPENGLISPAAFIPIFEKNGFITNLDLYIFEEVCIFLRKCIEHKWAIVPISVNFSRYDMFMPNIVQQLEEIRQKYDVPSKYLRIEITESVMIGGSDYINEIIKKLHHYGYIVEMDDFGSGYSSLNVLKDMDLDIIKLDMKFLSQTSKNNRGGTILSSIIRMAKWLNLPVIAEGVETVEQADFLRSIGCDYIQGYLYSKPLPEKDYVSLISQSRIGTTVPQMTLIDTMNAFDFWDPKSQETLIFSNYVGAAAIFDFHDNQIEILRVNKKYLQELGMNMSEKDLIDFDLMASMNPPNQQIYLNMLSKAIETMQEQECETWRNISSSCCGDENFCIRSTVQVIGVSDNRFLFHAMIRNITSERLYYNSLLDSERRFKMASEQVNIYYWEYNVATKEMRPCFRCMRDLGLPALLTNYPEPAIESGIFPPEVADMYRDWHRQIEAGVSSLEAVIPLTLDRVPFRVRYTTEFDENGYPIKAYGSAALIA